MPDPAQHFAGSAVAQELDTIRNVIPIIAKKRFITALAIKENHDAVVLGGLHDEGLHADGGGAEWFLLMHHHASQRCAEILVAGAHLDPAQRSRLDHFLGIGFLAVARVLADRRDGAERGPRRNQRYAGTIETAAETCANANV